MTSDPERPFWTLDKPEVAALAEQAGARLSIPRDQLSSVEENLGVLVEHARILAAAVDDARQSAADVGPAFEP